MRLTTNSGHVADDLRECGYPQLAKIVFDLDEPRVTEEADRLRKHAVIMIPKPRTLWRRATGRA